MKVYKDIISGDEVASDTFPMEVVNDVVYKFTSKVVVKTENNNFDIGANPSEDPEAEKEDDVAASESVSVNQFVDSLRLQKTTFDKKSYMGYINQYMNTFLEKIK